MTIRETEKIPVCDPSLSLCFYEAVIIYIEAIFGLLILGFWSKWSIAKFSENEHEREKKTGRGRKSL